MCAEDPVVLRLEARSASALLFGMFDIVQLVQTICMGLPFAFAFRNFLSWLLENSVTGRFFWQTLQVTVSSVWSFFEAICAEHALALPLEARSPLAFLFDIVQLVLLRACVLQFRCHSENQREFLTTIASGDK